MDKQKAFLLLAIAAAAGVALYARRARASSSSPDELAPLYTGLLDEQVRIDAPLLEIPPVPFIAPPEPPPLVRFLDDAVDQVKDALKGLGLWSRKVPAKYRELFAMAGAQYRLPPGLLEAVAYRESRFRDDIITGAKRSSAGAVGIMQIVPRFHPEVGEAGALDPIRAVPYAAGYLRSLFEQFGIWKHAVAAYNAGPAAVKKYGGVPPFKETREYVAEISTNAGLA